MPLNQIWWNSWWDAGFNFMEWTVESLGSETLAVACVTFYDDADTGADFSDMLYGGSSMSPAVSLRRQVGIQPNSYFGAAIYHMLSPPSGEQQARLELTATAVHMGGIVITYGGGGALQSTASAFADQDTGGDPDGTDTPSVSSTTGGAVHDIMIEGIQGLTPDSTQNQLFGNSVNNARSVASERLSALGGNITMSWTWSINASYCHVVASYQPSGVSFDGFGGTEFTSTGPGGDDRFDVPGMPGFTSFHSFGYAMPTPYDTFKKTLELEKLLSNVKLI